ncbi:MAG TPA: hypothetical protein DEG43_13660 [Acidimicrobiaceae bacterium]|nr:hypothetical protein [Acidimicrobiaceae bacterium]
MVRTIHSNSSRLGGVLAAPPTLEAPIPGPDRPSGAQSSGSQPDAGREPLLDFWRACSILAVVVGHYLVAGVVRDGTALRGVNMLAVAPRLQSLTWAFQVMPLFFVVGGASNLVSLQRASQEGRSMPWVRSRIAKLMVPVGVFLVLLCAVITIARASGVAPWMIETAVRASTIQFWFLAVYILITLCSPLLVRVYRRFGRGSLVNLGALIALVDLISLQTDRGAPLGWLNAATVWIFCTLVGFELRVHLMRSHAGTTVRLLGEESSTRRVGWLLMGVGIGLGVALVRFGGYPISLIGVPGQARSNTSPPSLMLICACSWQVGFLLASRGLVESFCARRRVGRSLGVLNLQAMSIYCWHMAAFVLTALVAEVLGYSVTMRPTGSETILTGSTTLIGSTSWWLAKPLWVLLSALATVGLVLLVAPIQVRLARRVLGTSSGGNLAVVGAAAVILATAAVRITTGHLVGTGWSPIDTTTALLLFVGPVLLWWPIESQAKPQ